jgi:hypothetical protein
MNVEGHRVRFLPNEKLFEISHTERFGGLAGWHLTFLWRTPPDSCARPIEPPVR